MKDLHRERAAEIFGVPYEDVTPEMRAWVKERTFGDRFAGSMPLDFLTAEMRRRLRKLWEAAFPAYADFKRPGAYAAGDSREPRES